MAHGIIITLGIVFIAALLAGLFLYRRRKDRKPINCYYCTFSVPPGGDPITDGMYIFRSKPPD